ncbi:MAG: polyphosphate kinase 1 [Planctomycetes bacterium]|nr:polyphosphate kinase 1 [Planctomycetota bacterium]
MKLDDPKIFINRELSWLDFNFRVLAEAESDNVPLLDRLKFIAISSSNLDEFFMIRTSLVHRAIEENTGALGPDGLSPRETLAGISEKTHEMVGRTYECLLNKIIPSLHKEGIELLRISDLTKEELAYLEGYYRENVRPVLTPMAIDTSHPFPLLANLVTYILFKVKPIDSAARGFFSQTDTVLMQVPPGIRRFIKLPGSDQNKSRFAILDDVIIRFAGQILGGYEIKGAYPFRVTRDADFTVNDEEVDDLMQAIEKELRSRRRGSPVRLGISTDVPPEIVSYIQGELGLEERDVYHIPWLTDLKTLFGLIGLIDRPDLLDKKWPPHDHPLFLTSNTDIFDVVKRNDVILHHPYQKFDPVIQLLRQAAEDPDVLAIKITLYRVSGDSPLVTALMKAAQNGKQVTVLVELRARFDEEANINWARALDNAGAHVIYGVVGYKTHSKVCLVVRREEDGIRRYVHLGTGNYNDKTARLYTDIGYFTSRPDFGQDISSFFNVITGYSLPPKWNRIEMAPTGMRERFISMIEREIEKHSPETPGYIRAKMNSLIDPEIIKALYKASMAGVTIDLVVRGMCRLRARVKGLSENIRVFSILDRFLEHSRIYHFHNGGNEEVYCASADWMERNFDSRLELLFPIIDAQDRKTVLRPLDLAMIDNVKAWEMGNDGKYHRLKRHGGEKEVRSQEVLYTEASKEMERSKRKSGQMTFVARTSPNKK